MKGNGAAGLKKILAGCAEDPPPGRRPFFGGPNPWGGLRVFENALVALNLICGAHISNIIMYIVHCVVVVFCELFESKPSPASMVASFFSVSQYPYPCQFLSHQYPPQ